ncbi:MAG: imidazoleglycerol-phosphate dehydratase HisB [Atribacterota bacterium]|nr:imidazoleglycerol-phosphate dehydratase HisB [Atribacterota bacterium]
MGKRTGTVSRKTVETDISLNINLDGEGRCNIKSELPFLNHMLVLFCKHGFFDLQLKLNGDIEVAAHHSLEDLGICLGRAIKEALGEKSGIKRYGFYLLVMDEALVRITIDLSGRGRLFYNVPPEKIGRISQIDGEVWKEFFLSLAYEAGITLHIDLLKGENTHHIIEAIFKGFARALDQAIQIERRLKGNIPSSKGMLA